MKFGICADLSLAPVAAESGFDYIEATMTSVALAEEPLFERMASVVRDSGLKVEALNVMLPGTFRLTGPDADLKPVRAYLETGFARAEKLGAAVQVFGSGAARRMREGWDRPRAMDQLAEYLSMAAGIATLHGIRIAIEPLNPGECNLINTVADALELMRRASLPNVGVLADWYHMAVQDEGVNGVLDAGPALLHCHIANPEGRRFPLPNDGADFTAFFGALTRIGYAGRISVEGNGGPDDYADTLVRLKGCL